jgi:hypothetical protein
MSFQQILFIFLAVLFVAYISGSVVNVMQRRGRNLPGVSYRPWVRTG